MTFLELVLIAQATAAPTVSVPNAPEQLPPQVAEAKKVRGPTPTNNPAYWVSPRDYPSESLRAWEEGVSTFTLTVDPSGKITGCQIRESSNSARLDETTCTLATLRARFSPALDGQGQPMTGYYTNRVRWVIPVEAIPGPGSLAVSYVVEKDGKRTNCTATGKGSGERQAQSQQNPCNSPIAKVLPNRDAAGKPMRSRVTVVTTITVEDEPN
jgi:TonB family protein